MWDMIQTIMEKDDWWRDDFHSNYHMQYVLDEHYNPIPTRSDYLACTLLHDQERRTVAKTHIRFRGARIEISTVFLVFNHGFNSTPMLYETMIFAKGRRALDQYQERYTTREEAIRGHVATIRMVWQELKRKQCHSLRGKEKRERW